MNPRASSAEPLAMAEQPVIDQDRVGEERMRAALGRMGMQAPMSLSSANPRPHLVHSGHGRSGRPVIVEQRSLGSPRFPVARHVAAVPSPSQPDLHNLKHEIERLQHELDRVGEANRSLQAKYSHAEIALEEERQAHQATREASAALSAQLQALIQTAPAAVEGEPVKRPRGRPRLERETTSQPAPRHAPKSKSEPKYDETAEPVKWWAD